MSLDPEDPALRGREASLRFAVLGDPISHSLSPVMHNAAFVALGLPHEYVARRVPRGSLAQAVFAARDAGEGGLNLTVPHKQAALAVMDVLSPEAERIGAVNTVCFGDRGEISGHNTDGWGFVRALAELVGGTTRSRHAIVLGSGGASLAVVDALLHQDRSRGEDPPRGEEPPLKLSWVSRQPAQNRHALAGHPGVTRRDYAWLRRFGAGRGEGRADLLVNATTVGMVGGATEFPLEFPLDFLVEGSAVVDLVYPRPAGGLLDRAVTRGARVMDGRPMLLWQGLRSLELWLQMPLGRDVSDRMWNALAHECFGEAPVLPVPTCR